MVITNINDGRKKNILLSLTRFFSRPNKKFKLPKKPINTQSTMKQLQTLATCLVFIIFFTSCEKATVVSVAAADSFIKVIRNPSDTSKLVYGLVNSVFSYNTMISAKVVTPDNATIQLIDFSSSGNSLYKMPSDLEFTSTVPTPGNYAYTVNFRDGETITYTNAVSPSTITPVQIVSLVKSAGADSVIVSWKAVTNAQAYSLKITCGPTQVYYQNPFSDTSGKSILRLSFPIANAIFTQKGTYTFEIDDLLFETSEMTTIQSVGAAKKDIVL